LLGARSAATRTSAGRTRILRAPVTDPARPGSIPLRRPELIEHRRRLRRPLVRPEVPAALEEVELAAHARGEPFGELRRDERILARPEDEGGTPDLRDVRLPLLADLHRRAVE